MANQSLLFMRAFNTNRFTQILQISGLRSKASATVKAEDIPDAPKRPLTPFFKYTQDQRQRLQQQHPEWKALDITKQTGIGWQQASTSIKEQYTAQYKEELKVYYHKYAKYLTDLTDEQKVAIKERKENALLQKERRLARQTVKELNKPKKPLPPILAFALAESKARNIPYKDFLKMAKVEFAALSKKEQEKYIENVAQEKTRFKEELKQWEEKMIAAGYGTFVRQSTLEQKVRKNKRSKETEPTKDDVKLE